MPHPIMLSCNELSLAERVLRQPLEALLVCGGDSRMHPDPATGLNKYGAAPRVRNAAAFGNCTASSMAPSGFSGARATLDRLRAAARADGDDGVLAETEHLFETFRGRFRSVMRLEDADCEIAFCPSGTDAEMLALAIARAGGDGPFLNVVTGPSEVGGGTTLAAGAKHFNEHVPCGERREPGSPIDGVLGTNVRVETVTLRAPDGRLLGPDELDREAERLVRAACAEQATVMLHVVTHSKTGVYAPSFDKVAELKEEFGDQVIVLLDAAQGRLSRKSVKAALDLDYLVLMTGSKFYGGPPFSGVLLVPPSHSPRRTELDELSPGMRDYMTAPELPPDWSGMRESLPAQPNPGLVLRWSAALAQMERYYEVDSSRRRAVMRALEAFVRDSLGASSLIEIAPVTPIRERDSLRFLEAATTVFPFFVGDGEAPLGRDELKRVFRLLNRDISGALPDLSAAEKGLLSRKIHIGQPVLLSGEADEERSVLRVALGGPMVVKVATDEGIGASFETRLDWLRAQLEILRVKTELIVENLDELREW